MTLTRSRLAAPALIALVALTAACNTSRNATTEAASTGTDARMGAANEAGPAPVAPPARAALPPVASGGTVGERQTAMVAPSTGPGTVDPMSRAMAASIAEIGERVYFDTDSYALNPEARGILERQAAWMQANPGARFMIAGNADERGTREYNLALGARRANAVRDYLISLGIAPARLETVSYGKERPVDPRPNPEGWAMNRNAQTVVLGGQ
jgi:peptidoglycan-associated lipoprotein